MTDLLDYAKRIEDRKRWHWTIAQFDDDVEKCEYCGGPMEQGMWADPATDSVEYYSICKNPDCSSNETDY